MTRGPGFILAPAEWLCDAYGDDDETPHDFIEDARDLVAYMESHGIMVRKRPKTFNTKPKPKVDFKPKVKK